MNIELVRVSKSFGDKQVLKDCSISFPCGQKTVILGPSGYGKTTILRILLGLESPDEGDILGLETQMMAAVFQENRLCDALSVYKNLQIVAKEKTAAEIEQALQSFGLNPPYDLPVANYSGGMQRRVALLRALLVSSTCVIFDEPFKGLDQETKQLIIAKTLKHIEGKTAIFVLHEPDEVKLLQPDQIIRLDEV